MVLVRATPSQLSFEQAPGTVDYVKGRRALFGVSGCPGNSDHSFRARRRRTGELRGRGGM
jgi:hypothetical protein